MVTALTYCHPATDPSILLVLAVRWQVAESLLLLSPLLPLLPLPPLLPADELYLYLSTTTITGAIPGWMAPHPRR
jgi:hypothetical protein